MHKFTTKFSNLFTFKIMHVNAVYPLIVTQLWTDICKLMNT